MLTPRTAVVCAAVLCAALAVNAIATSRRAATGGESEFRSDRLGRAGTHALCALLSELGFEVERRPLPFTGDEPLAAVLLLIDPDPLLVRTEPEPLERIRDWVGRGGRLVVAPHFATGAEQLKLAELARELPHFDADLLPELGLADVQVKPLPVTKIPTETAPNDDELMISRVVDDDAASEIEELVTLGGGLPELLIPAGVNPRWATRIHDAEGTPRVLAAAFPRGAGEVVLVADATLLSNVTLPRGDNATWFIEQILSGRTGPILVDEFYHGLTIRGNAWWLLTQPAYALPAVCGLVCLGLWTWRTGRCLGPPLADAPPSRRAVSEYVSAMARFFQRGADAQRFVLHEVRSGVQRRLADETGLPLAGADPERLAAAIARRQPHRGTHVAAAFAACDAVLQAERSTSAERLDALRQLRGCLPDSPR